MAHQRAAVCVRAWARLLVSSPPSPTLHRCLVCGTPVAHRAPVRSSWAAVGSTRSRAFVAVASADAEQSLPATFVAPTTVNMDDFPPPKRRLSKGEAPSVA